MKIIMYVQQLRATCNIGEIIKFKRFVRYNILLVHIYSS